MKLGAGLESLRKNGALFPSLPRKNIPRRRILVLLRGRFITLSIGQFTDSTHRSRCFFFFLMWESCRKDDDKFPYEPYLRFLLDLGSRWLPWGRRHDLATTA